jgi:nitrite reductase/ring-hydroxylating ferredoxin subunit
MADFTNVGRVSDFEPGVMRLFEVEGEEVIVALIDGAFHAFSNKCPHANQPLIEGELRGRTVECAYHAGIFNVESGKVVWGYYSPLAIYDVRVEGEEVQVGRRRAPFSAWSSWRG